MSVRSAGVLDRKLRKIEESATIRVAERTEMLRAAIYRNLPDTGPFTRWEALVVLVNDTANDIAAIHQQAMRDAFDQSLIRIRRDTVAVVNTMGRRDLFDDILGGMRRIPIIERWFAIDSGNITVITDRLLVEADRQWQFATKYEDDWQERLAGSGKIRVLGRRGRSLFSTYPGLVRSSLIEALWGIANDDVKEQGKSITRETEASLGKPSTGG